MTTGSSDADFAAPLPGTAERILDDGSPEVLIREEPLSIEVGGESVLTMRTPGADEELATGFLMTEDVIQSPADIEHADWQAGDPAALRADTIRLRLRSAATAPRGRLTRTHEIRPSCGLCGFANPEELLEDLPALLPAAPRLTAAAASALVARLPAVQPHFAATGASHSAAVFAADGTLWGSGEDVGRHNALDKAIGAAARAQHELARGIAVLSGRAGFDLVLKCLRVRIGVVLSVSAASAQSFDLCRAAGATLAGFVREGRMRVYLDGGRLD